MSNIPNFKIENRGEISKAFLENGISSFENACQFVANLPYKRNLNKEDLKCIFKDFGGTCSTKHAVLRKLALENEQNEVKLILGIFKMDSLYAPSISKTLETYHLDYIPEAHNYLKINDEYFDFTRHNTNYKDFKYKLLSEQEIEFNQITTDKVAIHKHFLEKWIKEEYLEFSIDEIWKIREQCILDLQINTN